MSVCVYVADGRPNGWADQDQTWHGDSYVDPGSVLVKVKVKVIWCHLANANKTPYRGPQLSAERIRARSAINTADRGPQGLYRRPQGRDNRSSAKRDKYGGQRPARAERIEARRAETTPSGGRVITASYY